MASTASRFDSPPWRHSDRQVQNDTALTEHGTKAPLLGPVQVPAKGSSSTSR